MRRLGVEEPTWEEFYGENVEEAKPFDEFFTKPSDEEDYLQGLNGVRRAWPGVQGYNHERGFSTPQHAYNRTGLK